jgi:hypothetical protein
MRAVRKLICRLLGHKWPELIMKSPRFEVLGHEDPNYFVSFCSRCGCMSHWHRRGPVWHITTPFHDPRKLTPKEELLLDEVLAHQ